MEQALRTADLLLQAEGFSAIVLDMASLAPEFVSRVPLATWHRYRLAAERIQSSILLLTQHSCAKSSAELLLRLQPSAALCDAACARAMGYASFICLSLASRMF
jgi:recombination protein RecA